LFSWIWEKILCISLILLLVIAIELSRKDLGGRFHLVRAEDSLAFLGLRRFFGAGESEPAACSASFLAANFSAAR
jgi:hypothetical protein